MDETVKVKITCNTSGGKYKLLKFEGRDHIVTNMVIIPEGVLAGSEGPGLYLTNELEKTPVAWNNKPIVLNHPDDGTADDPAVIEETKFGTVFKAAVKNKKLSAQAYIDIEKADKHDPLIVKNIKAGKPVELSSGIFLKKKMEKGTHKATGMAYEWIAHDIKPDHVAVFAPSSGMVGAASVRDGAGVGVNNKSAKPNILPCLNRMLSEAMKKLGGTYTENQLSFSDIQCSLSDLLSTKFGEPGKYWRGWIVDVYENSVVFRADDDGELYQINYSKTDKGGVSLSGDAVKVERSVQYVTANGLNLVPVDNHLSPKETVMAKKVTEGFDKEAHIEKLTTNGKFDPSFIEALKGMSDDALQKITCISNEAEPEPTPAPVKPVLNKKKDSDTPAPQTEEEYVANAPKFIQDIYNAGKKQKADLVAELIKISNKSLSPKFLEKMDIDDLQGLKTTLEAKAVTNKSDDDEGDSLFLDGTNYVGNGGAPVLNKKAYTIEEDGIEVPTLNFSDIRSEREKGRVAV